MVGNMTEEEAQELLVYLNTKYISYTQMQIKPGRCGHAHISQKWFSLPTWVLNLGICYATYYIIHEFIHCEGYHRHDDAFKDKERQMLVEFGVSVIYAKAYPKCLIANGEIVYENK